MPEHGPDCDHTKEEHDDQLKRMQDSLQQGDLSPLIATLTNENLLAAFQMATIEVLIRTESHESAKELWEHHSQLVHDTFFVANADDSIAPEWYNEVITARQKYLKGETNMGAVEFTGTRVDPIDTTEYPGQYL